MTDSSSQSETGKIGMRGLFMLVVFVLYHVAEFVALAVAVLRFVRLLISKQKNEPHQSFGEGLSRSISGGALLDIQQRGEAVPVQRVAERASRAHLSRTATASAPLTSDSPQAPLRVEGRRVSQEELERVQLAIASGLERSLG